MHKLPRYIVRRVLHFIPVILAVLIFNFVLIKLAPGDPALTMAGEWATTEQVEMVRQKWGLDQPLTTQLLRYLGNLFRGDLGFSYHYHMPVLEVIMLRLPKTFLLVLTAMILGIVLGTLIGVYSASRYDTRPDLVLSVLSLVFYSIPVFWLGLLLIIVFGLNLKWFPFTGYISFGVRGTFSVIVDVLWHMVMPAVTLMACLYIPVFLRISRASVVEVMKEDYITTARAAGLGERAVFTRHALRNAMVPVVQMVGVWMSQALTGVVLTETVFAWPGMGTLMYTAIIMRDYPLLMGIFLITAVWVVMTFLVVDIATAYLDPRVTYD